MTTERKEISPFDLFKLESSNEESVSIDNVGEIANDIPTKDNDTEEELEEEESTDTSTDDEEAEENTSTDDSEEIGVFSSFANTLIEDDILIPLEGKEYEEAEEGLKELVQDTIKSGIDAYITSKPKIAQDFITFLDNGGDPEDFISKVSEVRYKDIDVEDVDNQRNLIKEHLISQGVEDEEIEEMITEYEDLNNLAKHAKIAQKVLSKKQEEEYELTINQQKQEKIVREQTLKQQEEEFKNTVFSFNELAGMKLTDTDKNKFYSYLTKPVKKDESGNLLTQYQVDLLATDKRLELAFYQFKGGIKEIEKKIEKKKTLNLKQKLSHFVDKNNASSSNSMNEDSGHQESTRPKIKLPYSFMQ